MQVDESVGLEDNIESAKRRDKVPEVCAIDCIGVVEPWHVQLWVTKELERSHRQRKKDAKPPGKRERAERGQWEVGASKYEL